MTSRSELSPLSFLKRSSDLYSDSLAVQSADDGRVFTYSELKKRALMLGTALRNHGVLQGDRVALFSMNNPELLEAHFGVPLAGAVLVAINFRLLPSEMLYIVQHSEAKVLICDGLLSDAIDHIQPELQRMGCTTFRISHIADDENSSVPTYEELLSLGRNMGEFSFDVSDEESLIALDYTSGTTGVPKGVMYSHRGAYLNAISDLIFSELTHDSVYLWTLPMFHCNGWCYTWAVVGAGARSITISRAEPSKIWSIIENEGVTHLCAAPTVLISLSDYVSSSSRSISLKEKLRIFTGGAPPAPKVIENMEQLGAEVVHLYGMTETYGPNILCEPKDTWKKLGMHEKAIIKARQGVPHIIGTDTKVVDEDMNEVPHDGKTLGEIVMRGNTVMKGYFKDPILTSNSFRGGWFHSGDLAVVHPDGYLEIIDRSKDIIISGGEKISSIEVEKVLYSHPSILEVAVIAVPDEKWGEVPKAYLTLRAGHNVTFDELNQFCRERLAHFKCPKHFEFANLPKTSTGKIMKYPLRQKEWEGFDRKV